MKRILLKSEEVNRIGIDKVSLKVIVDRYDKIFLEKKGLECSERIFIKDQDINSHKTLKIVDDEIGRFSMGIKKDDNTRKDDVDYAYLSFSPKNIYGQNVKNFSYEELLVAIGRIKKKLYDEYKISLDTEEAIFTSIEINFNYITENNLKDFQRVLGIYKKNIPYMKKHVTTGAKQDKNCDELETLCINNTEQKIIFYDKTNEIKKEDIEIEFDDENYDGEKTNIIRFENTLKNTRRIESILGTNRVTDMNQEHVEEKFREHVEKLIIKPYESYKNDSRREIKKVLNSYKNEDRTGKSWPTSLIIEVLIKEIKLEYPLVLDKEDLIEVAQEVFCGDPNKTRIIKSINKAFNQVPCSYFDKNERKKFEDFIYYFKKPQIKGSFNEE